MARTDDSDRAGKGETFQFVGLALGALAGLAVLLFTNLDPERPQVTATAAVAVLMAVWWITEALPLAATALVPVALFPLLGIMDGKKVAGQYFNHVIFLFIGGFIVAPGHGAVGPAPADRAAHPALLWQPPAPDPARFHGSHGVSFHVDLQHRGPP